MHPGLLVSTTSTHLDRHHHPGRLTPGCSLHALKIHNGITPHSWGRLGRGRVSRLQGRCHLTCTHNVAPTIPRRPAFPRHWRVGPAPTGVMRTPRFTHTRTRGRRGCGGTITPCMRVAGGTRSELQHQGTQLLGQIVRGQTSLSGHHPGRAGRYHSGPCRAVSTMAHHFRHSQRQRAWAPMHGVG